AIIIALACKNLPAEQRKKAVFLGCAGAIILRVLLTLVATKLLEIPYLQFIGGVALLFIAIKLLKPEEEDLSNIESSGKLWAAVKTILAADFIMSLDNVLSLAAVAQTVPEGKYLLILLGLLVSIPLVVWGAQLLLKLIQRFPAIIYVGAAILGYAAAEMMVADHALGIYMESFELVLRFGLPLLIVAIGLWMKKKAETAN
ncbi:MAG: TerC family protein, partial [Selenomonadales bacterium]|nr:TerC family protein [Selenomonadales bacterium]